MDYLSRNRSSKSGLLWEFPSEPTGRVGHKGVTEDNDECDVKWTNGGRYTRVDRSFKKFLFVTWETESHGSWLDRVRDKYKRYSQSTIST